MSTLVVSGARALSALDIMRAFHADGWRVVAADSMHLPPARFSRAVDRFVRIAPPGDRARFDADVARLLAAERPRLWIATCEEIFHLAALRERALPELPLFAPPLAELLAVHDKARFAAMASTNDLAPPETIRLERRSDVEALQLRAEDLVFKPVWSRFAERVLVGPHPSALDDIAPSPDDPWIAQTYLPGEEVCTFGIARRGRLLVHAAYRPQHRVRDGAGIYFEPAHDAAIATAVATLVEALDWTGEIAFDFRRDAAGQWKAIECNPRATSGVHLVPPRDLVAAIVGAADDSAASAPGPIAGMRDGAAMIAAAMRSFGLGTALRRRALGRFLRDYRRARDVASIPGDRGPGLAQVLVLGEGMARAVRRGVGLTRAVSYDLEWNGPPEHRL